ncbi:MAG TPA: CbiQ family ECF transporter T component [Natronosporangium sp.]|nr:CbiQ family ECF transporter T component [Natronosporangium sp.]
MSIPRALHPGAWWVWALGLAVAASRTTNPLLLVLLLAVAGLVVATRRGDAPWALAFRMYLLLAAVIVAMRVGFRILVGGGAGDHILIILPELPLPEAAAGIRLLGPVTAEQILSGFYDGLRLATMLVCVGAANALANPKRLLKAMPGALSEISTAVVVALSTAPQLVDSALRVRRARRLRGGRDRGLRAVHRIAVPVLVDTLDRSLRLAAAMESRGYGRTAGVSRRTRAVNGALMLVGLLGVCVGSYGLLDATAPPLLGAPMLTAGVLVAVLGLGLGGRRIRRSVYRPDRWRAAELAVAGCGIVAAIALHVPIVLSFTDLHPPVTPLTWPTLPPLAAVGVLVAALPAVLAPPAPVTMPTASATPVRVPKETHR